MNYDQKLASGIRDLNEARQFQELFPDAEHVIVQAKHHFEHGWRLVDEWISRASFYDRYTLWLAMPIEFTASGAVSPLDKPDVHFVEVEKVERGRDEEGGPKWEYNFARFEQGDWEELVEVGGDFKALGADLITDNPVEGFATFWRDTSPPPEDPAPDGLALRAPLRFMG